MFVWQLGEDRMWGKMSPNSGLFNRLGPFEDVSTVHELKCERRRRFKIANINNLKSKGYSTRITCFKKWICIILPVMAWYNADSYEVVIDITYFVVSMGFSFFIGLVGSNLSGAGGRKWVDCAEIIEQVKTKTVTTICTLRFILLNWTN